jgi:hypothetical protein
MSAQQGRADARALEPPTTTHCEQLQSRRGRAVRPLPLSPGQGLSGLGARVPPIYEDFFSTLGGAS